MKIDIDTVQHILSANSVDASTIKQVMKDIENEVKLEQADKEQKQKVEKYKAVIVLENLPSNAQDLTPLVVECIEEVQHDTILQRISAAAKEANSTAKKFKKKPLKSIYETIQLCPPKFLKNQGIKKITKEIPIVIPTDNTL